MTTSNQFEGGIAFARAAFAQLDCRGTKWKTRNVPAYIREHLWMSHYLTEKSGEQLLYVIRPPDELNPKVHFVRWPPLEPA
ncbi:hypothetical protein [Larkinella knui]|uniref:Uncharacterized protein n=1 Tax=Larkinella knui TaxID=2025310 RepID=A0A3P1CHV4_9BACT|nr:hypothetical protein [Larkinella knui]RRB12464.1 hypothetical protein EHT87_19895 [Larkinella knui]